MKKRARELMPSILGGYLDLFSAVLRELPKVELSSEDRKNRLVDYIQLGEAVSRVRKKEPGVFVSQYVSRRQDEVLDLFDDNPVAGALAQFFNASPHSESSFTGAVGDLWTRLKAHNVSNKGFPASAKGLKDELNRIVGPMERAGIKVEFGNVVNGRRRVTVAVIEGGPFVTKAALEAVKVAAAAEATAKKAAKFAEITAAAQRMREAKKLEVEMPHPHSKRLTCR
jgi:hypothetical protein